MNHADLIDAGYVTAYTGQDVPTHAAVCRVKAAYDRVDHTVVRDALLRYERKHGEKAEVVVITNYLAARRMARKERGL